MTNFNEKQPPKELTGSDLARAMPERGDLAVTCKCADTNESDAIEKSPLRLAVKAGNDMFMLGSGSWWNYAVIKDRVKAKKAEPVIEASAQDGRTPNTGGTR